MPLPFSIKEIVPLYISQYREHYAIKGYSHFMTEREVSYISDLVKETNSKLLLDYGSGPGIQYTNQHINRQMGILDENVTLYDPGVLAISNKPQNQFDIVICTDVMEHIPEDFVPSILQDVFSFSTCCVYFCIATQEAVTILPNGENAHCTRKPPDWWEPLLQSANKRKLRTKVRWYGDYQDTREYCK